MRNLKRWLIKKESWRSFGIKSLIVLLSLWFVGSAFASRYRIGIDPQQEKCLPGYTVFIIDLADKSLERNGIYAFSARNMQPLFEDGTQMVKILAGMPGDTVAIDERLNITVNDELVGQGLKLAEKIHQPISNFIGSATLSADQYWFMGKSYLSFDSRYWGAVNEDQIIGRAYPIF